MPIATSKGLQSISDGEDKNTCMLETLCSFKKLFHRTNIVLC